MSRSMRRAVSAATVRGVRATLNSRADAAAVTGSRVCADSIVEMRTSKGSSWLSCAIFSTAGSWWASMARASARMIGSTVDRVRVMSEPFSIASERFPSLGGAKYNRSLAFIPADACSERAFGDRVRSMDVSTMVHRTPAPLAAAERERLEAVGFMTCMTLVMLGNYSQTGHFGG